MRKDTHQQFNWSGSIEQLEDRLVMSADPLGGFLGGQVQQHTFIDDLPGLDQHVVAEQAPALDHHTESLPDFWISSENQNAIEQELRDIEQQLANAHDQTGLTQVRSNYGFTGIGQTVAVIDSGIAYDHYALGGGFGQNYRVVGGYDFTGENDSDPYDDGPSGSHGTHVSGIIGGDAGAHNGVAPGVDLVGLRVFDDAGAGYFSWVNDALNWVHNNRNSFENPITAVNLSLGVASWNSDSIPSWANLETAFAQLEADGIFISVSAGNSYTSFNQTGLSYPAASQYVVPVASVDDGGLLSYFSQRNSRVIAAPGRSITSTVPDYKGDNNGVTDDYASFSGTSMAAPYVAGASVIIREAMEFAGYTNIDQDTIYDHMIATADSFYDSATSAFYNRLNLEAAIDALMPADDYGSTVATAYNLGTINASVSTSSLMSGAITTLNDVDYFKFTAGNNGTVSFTASNMTHQVGADWDVTGGTSSWSGANNETLTVDVVAGQQYTVGFLSDDGLGYYDLDITAESSFSFTDWGSIASSQIQNVSVADGTWYRVEAANAGYFTVGTQFDAAGNQVSLELYNSNLQLVDSGTANNGTSRVDTYAAAGQELFIKVLGTNADVDFQLTNLVSVNGTTVNVAGTAGDDAFAFSAGSTHQVTVNGVTYSFAAIAVSNIQFAGGTGNDTVIFQGTSADETAELRVGQVELTDGNYTVTATGIESSIVLGGGGNDTATFFDSAGDDTLVARPTVVTLSGNGFSNTASNFSKTYAYATLGNDHVEMHDSAGNDDYRAYSNRSVFKGNGFYNSARNFDTSQAYSTQGTDSARLYDSAGDDTYTAHPDHVILTGNGFYNRADNFRLTYAYASTGNDIANLYDSAGYDTFRAYHDKVALSGSGYYNYARLFDQNYAHSTTGNDFAKFYDSVGNDELLAYDNQVTMTGTGYLNSAQNFRRTQALSLNGQDIARFYGSAGNDTYIGHSDYAKLVGTNFNNQAKYFSQNYAYSTAGNDIAFIYDSTGDDLFEAYSDHATFSGTGVYHEVSLFSKVTAVSTQGNDVARFFDSTGDDDFRAYADRATMQGSGFYNRANGFFENYGYSSQGTDVARFYDSAGDDLYESYHDRASLSGTGFYNFGSGFSATYAYASTGDDTAIFHDSAGNDTYRAYHDKAMMSGAGFYNYARLFDQTYATSTQGDDLAKFYDSIGDDSVYASAGLVTLSGASFNNHANDFARVQAHSLNGGNDTADVSAADSVFDLLGSWA